VYRTIDPSASIASSSGETLHTNWISLLLVGCSTLTGREGRSFNSLHSRRNGLASSQVALLSRRASANKLDARRRTTSPMRRHWRALGRVRQRARSISTMLRAVPCIPLMTEK
jgi:hypothetical protein